MSIAFILVAVCCTECEFHSSDLRPLYEEKRGRLNGRTISVSLHFSTIMRPFFFSSLSSLDLGAPLILGRVPAEFGYADEALSSLRGFSGCLRNVLVKGQAVDFGSPVNSSDVTLGCGCDPEQCKNDGACSETGQCDCSPEFTGPDCTEGV